MKVGIYSTNPQVNSALLSMCASCGCKVQKILKYNKDLFKGSDLIIIDLDNAADSEGLLRGDVQSLPEILFVGISKELDILDEYRTIMNVEKKPFSSNIFRNYKKLVLSRLESSVVVTKDENRTYDELGLNLAETFGKSNISIEERFNALKKTIESKSHYEPENVFLKKIGLDDVEYREPKRIEVEKIDIAKSIANDAIVKYRIRKLKMMNLSNKMIDDKINEIINSNIATSVNKTRITSAEKDILSKLREKGQAGTGSSFKAKKEELEAKKKIEVEKPIEPNIPKPVEMPKVEEKKEEPKAEIKKPSLNKPILSNGPNMKAANNLKKPMIGLEEIVDDFEEIPKKEKEIEIKKEVKSVEVTEKPEEIEEVGEEVVEIPKEPPKKPAGFVKPQLSIEEDKKPKIITPPPNIQGDIASDPLLKLRERKQKEKEEMLAKQNDKTTSGNNNQNNIIKDNNGTGFGSASLVDQMQEKIGYINTHRGPKKETAFDIANKKSKPPR